MPFSLRSLRPFGEDSYQILKVETSGDMISETVSLTSLSSDWKNNKDATRAIEDDWLERVTSALLRIPLVIMPETCNWLLNPRHAEARKAAILQIEKHLYDSRLFKR